MDLENIKFCNSTIYKINNETIIFKIFSQIQKLLNNSGNNNFKIKDNEFHGPQPVAIEKKDLETLKNNKYVVCEKSDGERYILLLINVDNNPFPILINRNNEIYFTELTASKEMFVGTIFDGEIIKTKKGVWTYLIHDCMAFNGTNMSIVPHSQRYGAVIDFITKRYTYNEDNPFCIKTKIFYNYTPDIEKTWNHILSTTENEIDGLIFTPVNSDIVSGRQKDLFKWKNGKNHTIDLLVKLINNKLHTYYSNNKIFKKITNTDKEYSLIFNFCSKDSLIKGTIIEFKYDLETLTPYRIRTDKCIGNSKLTIDNTIKNIVESLEIQDLY